jgi:membrane protease YdiL (CAAX protease family)
MKERFTGADYRFLAICAVLLAGATWFSVRNFYRAFPEASIDFRVNRAQGETIASQFLTSRGFATEAYRRASSFTYDDETKTFLEREVGLEKANQLMGSRIRLWRWSYRWFRPLQKEEFRADVTPDGALVGFDHELPEDAARPSVASDAARAAAEDFLRTHMHRDPAALDFVEASEVTRPHRTDRTYTWKERDFNLQDATYRLEVELDGPEIAGYREYLKIPEQWTRDYQRLRSKNEAASYVDGAFMVALLVGLLAVIVMRVRRQDIRWRRAAVVGMIGMALSFLSHLNQMPLQVFEYPTTDSYVSFMMRQLLNGVISALGAGGLLFVLTAGAEAVYREMFPDKVSLGNLFRAHGLRTKRFFLGACLGVTLCAIFIAYQTAFYIVAYRFGAWSPADVPYSDLLNTRFPWLFVLFGGFLPAVSEEFMFRMFGIPFLRKLMRSLPVAVVLAGFIWGFGHAAYPQQPFYIRGVEVGIGGVALGLIMLRWGILPTLVWHYSVDAMYSAMLLLRSQSLYFKLSGAASAGFVVLPAVLALVAYWRNGGFEPVTGLLNGDEAAGIEPTPPEPVPASAGAARWHPLSIRVRIAALALLALGVVAMAIPTERFGAAPVYKISAEQARIASDAFLRMLGANPDAFQHVTVPAVHWGTDEPHDTFAAKYFLERLPATGASQMFERHRPVQYWKTRYFKSLDQEEFLTVVHPETGKVLAFHHTVPEDRPGADTSDDSARAIATAFAASTGRSLAGMDLKENTSEKKKSRRDHALVWEAQAGDPRNVGDVRYRLQVQLAGDQPTSLGVFWKVPEDFIRARDRQNFLSIFTATLRIGLMAAFIVFGIWVLVRNIRNGLVPWPLTLKLAIAPALLTALGPLLSMRALLQNYPTAIPLDTFRAISYLVVLMSAIFGFVIYAGCAAIVTSFFPESLAALRREGRGILRRDAVFALLAAIGLGLLLHQANAVLVASFHGNALYQVAPPDLIVSAVPALAALADLRSVPTYAAVVALAALIVAGVRRRWLLVPLALLAAFFYLPLDVRTPGEFFLQYAVGLLAVAAASAFCFLFARSNALAYALVFLIMASRGPLVELFGNPAPGLSVQGWIVCAVLAAAVLWAVLPRAVPRVQSAQSE